jgi:ribosomal protein S18 acetylase RimI-like enzyme
MRLIPADQFTFEQLTAAYNQTRVDYLVPMPMNVARLHEYVTVYDVDLAASCVVMDDGNVLGLGMLGVRQGRGWITRLGVLPAGRRRGTGSRIMEWLLDSASRRRLPTVWLEVIVGNEPAHQLFCKHGFEATRELVVARRPPNPNAVFLGSGNRTETILSVTDLDHQQLLHRWSRRRQQPNWINERETMAHLPNLIASMVELESGGRGWASYQAGLLQLTRINVEVTAGEPRAVTAAILQRVHRRHANLDAVLENQPGDDPTWFGFEDAGYFESFRRLEMVRQLNC